MIITAKFSSRCPKCATIISAGSRVEWTKSTRARHVKCPAADLRVPRNVYIASTLDMLTAGTATLRTVREHEVFAVLPNGTVTRLERDATTEPVLAPLIAATKG